MEPREAWDEAAPADRRLRRRLPLLVEGALLGLVAAALLTGSLGSGVERLARAPDGAPVVAAETLGVERFNAIIAEAAGNRAPWTRDPLQIALAFIGGPSASELTVSRRDRPGEPQERSRVVLLEAGAPARWTAFELVHLDDGSWRLDEVLQARRCDGPLAFRRYAVSCEAG